MTIKNVFPLALLLLPLVGCESGRISRDASSHAPSVLSLYVLDYENPTAVPKGGLISDSEFQEKYENRVAQLSMKGQNYPELKKLSPNMEEK